jgi:hypothetical protein
MSTVDVKQQVVGRREREEVGGIKTSFWKDKSMEINKFALTCIS